MKFEQFLNESSIKELKDKLKDDKNYLKAPNGKKTNLTEYQWLTVRTDAFKKWFGDWENDKANASKVLDENNEPLVAYHGTDANFTKFESDRKGTNGEDFGELIFFTSSSLVASGYAIRLKKSEEFNQADKNLDNEWEKVRQIVIKDGVTSQNFKNAKAEWDKHRDSRNQVYDDILSFKIITDGAVVMNGFINMRKPHIVDGKGLNWRDVHHEAFEEFHNGNYDGVIIKNVNDSANTFANEHTTIYAFPKSNQVKAAIGNKTFDSKSDHIHESY